MEKVDIPNRAKVVIVGGGVIGCSVAYHLSRLGWQDVVLLERKKLTSGTTWHAAGLIGQLRATKNMTKLAKYSQELYLKLEAETNVATGFRQNGSITLALTLDRLEELRRGADMARAFGVLVNEISVPEINERYPGLNLEDCVGGVFLEKDGQADPVNITQALAKGARQKGVQIFENVKVDDIYAENGIVSGVLTKNGEIDCQYVVNCGGMWARELGKMVGVSIPLHACEHFYVVTEEIEGLKKNLPVLRVPDECAYYKEDAGKVLLGCFEKTAKPWGGSGIPDDFEFTTLPDDIDHFEPILEKAIRRMPILAHTGLQTFFNGPESFTPDNRYLLGESPEIKNFFVAAGFNSVGIQSAGGAGMVLANWMASGHPTMDLWDVDIRRVQPFQVNRRYLASRVEETLGLLYADHFPYRQFASARNIRKTPLHHKLEDQQACFGELAGWERPNWFLPKNVPKTIERIKYKYSWTRQNWFDYSKKEHLSVRQGAALFDLSSFGKIKVIGPDAEDVLQKVCANNVAVCPGKIVYTQWLNEKGGIEADLTVTRISPEEFLVVTPTITIQRDISWLKRNTPSDSRCLIIDVTSSEAVIAVMGPASRKVLQPIIQESLDNQDFPYGTMKNIEIGCGIGRAHRVSYVGELGWEIYVSCDLAEHVFDTILESGGSFGLVMAGMHALDSCRIEKAFRHFGHDISDEDHVLEAGLDFAVDLEKPKSTLGDFIGYDSVRRVAEKGLTRRLLQFQLIDPSPLLFHNEPIVRDGEIAGYLTSGAYGHHLGGAIGLGYVSFSESDSLHQLLESKYEIIVANKNYKALHSVKALYDPYNTRMQE